MMNFQNEMTESQVDLAMKWSRNKHGKCPMCNDNNWDISPFLYLSMPSDNKYPLALIGKYNTMPYFVLLCANCGYMASINAVIAGIIKEPTHDLHTTV